MLKFEEKAKMLTTIATADSDDEALHGMIQKHADRIQATRTK